MHHSLIFCDPVARILLSPAWQNLHFSDSFGKKTNRFQFIWFSGPIGGTMALWFDSGQAGFQIEYQKGQIISAGYYEQGKLKYPITYEKIGLDMCRVSMVEKGERKSQIIKCIENSHPEIFHGCNGI